MTNAGCHREAVGIEALFARNIAEYAYREFAAVTRVQTGTVMPRLTSARRRLVGTMEDAERPN
jgi:DNA-directed RNA polymerase specialized sigma24 family protein